jgi:hypothetical protein
MRLGVTLSLFLAAGTARGDLVGPCDKLLVNGIRAHVAEATQKGFWRASYEPLCAAFERASRDATGAAAREAWAAVGGEGEYDRARFDKLKTAYCALSRSVAADRQAYREAAIGLAPQAVKQWERCDAAVNGKYGPPMEVEQLDELTLSVSLKPAARDLRSVRVVLEGFDWCSGALDGTRPGGVPARVEIPILARNRDHDIACFRRVDRNAPCGSLVAPPASLRIEFRDGDGEGDAARREHTFQLARVMAQCPVPPLP